MDTSLHFLQYEMGQTLPFASTAKILDRRLDGMEGIKAQHMEVKSLNWTSMPRGTFHQNSLNCNNSLTGPNDLR